MLPVAILAGGLATRMRPMTETIPKAMREVAGEPFVSHPLRLLQRAGVKKVVFCIGYLGEQIESAVGNGSAFGLDCFWSSDWPELRGTGGALKQALPLLGERFMVLYGDSYLDVPYADVAEAFRLSGLPALMTVYRNNGRYDASNVIFHDGHITLYDKKLQLPEMRYIDYGLGCLCASLFNERPDCFDLADIYTELSRQEGLAGYEASTRFYEIGSPTGLRELDALLSDKENNAS